MNILVTGATSFLGTETVRTMLAAGHTVYAPVRASSARRSLLPRDPGLHVVDASLDAPRRILDAGIPELSAAVSFAWAGVGVKGRMDPAVQEDNLRGTLGFMEAAAALGAKRFLFAGSQAEYGVTTERVAEGMYDGGPVTEETAARPVSEYGKAKLRVLKEGVALAESLGMEYRHMRIFSVYGAGDHETSLVSSCVRAASSGGTAELGPCAQQWNFLYVQDCAEAITALALKEGGDADMAGALKEGRDAGSSGAGTAGLFNVFNIGSRDTRQLKNFVNEIFETAGRGSCVFRDRPAGPEGTPWLAPDIGRISAFTGWTPQTSFRDGILSILKESERNSI